MSSLPVNGKPATQSKSSKKKRAKAEVSTNASESTPSIPDVDSKPEPSVNGVSDEAEGALFKELQKYVNMSPFFNFLELCLTN